MRVLGIDVGIESMGLCVVDAEISDVGSRGRRAVTDVSVIGTEIVTVLPFAFAGTSECIGKTRRGKPCKRRVSHAKLCRGDLVASCPGHAKEFSCKIMSGMKLRPGLIFEQLTEKFSSVSERFPGIELVVIESQPKMSNMFPIQYSVEIAAHVAFPDAATAFFPSGQKLRQLGIKAPRGKRKHGERKGLASKAIRDAITAGSIQCSDIEVSVPAETIPENPKKYDDIADALIVAVAGAKRILPTIELVHSKQLTDAYSLYGLSGLL